MSSFKSLDLFGSGPHRFTLARQGRRVIPYAAVADPTVPGSFTAGDHELRITVTGRLVANTDAALWTLRDAITAQAASTATAGTLTDNTGRSWPDLKLLTFTPQGPTDHARTTSLPYTAEFGTTTE